MDGKRPTPLTDAALDRELEAALDVDPSPEFLARVRMRVANEPAPTSWRAPWTGVAAAAAAAVVVIAVTVSNAPDDGPVAPRRAAAPRPTPREGVPAPAPAPRVAESRPAVRPRTRVAPVVTPAAVHTVAEERRPFPEVLVSADEVRAYQMLLGIVEQQRLPPPPVAAAAADDVVDLSDIQLASLRIEALPPLARLEGER